MMPSPTANDAPGSPDSCPLAAGIRAVLISDCAVKFTRPADQRAAAVIPAQLDELRKKERLRELFRQLPDVPDDLATLAAELGPLAGLTPETALPWLAAFVAEDNPGTRRRALPVSGAVAV